MKKNNKIKLGLMNCKRCKKEIQRTNNSMKYCSDCAILSDRVSQLKYKEKNRVKSNKKDLEYYHKHKARLINQQRAYQQRKLVEYKVRQWTYKHHKKKGVCIKCKKEGKTDFHHITYVPNIFIEVCRICHKRTHGKIASRLEELKSELFGGQE